MVLPTPRWQHLGGLSDPALNDLPVEVGRSDGWYATDGPWPYRLGIDPALLDPVRPRLRRVRWGRGRYGAPYSLDVYGDESVVMLGLRGSSADEIGMLVRLDSGLTLLIVGDAVWRQEQVTDLRPRPAWSTWFLDRNRMQLANTQRWMNALNRDSHVVVVPLADARMAIAEYPDWAD